MKKVNVTITCDEEKVKALRWYLDQKDVQLEDELSKLLESLFVKNVPASVRSYITRDSDVAADGDAPKPQRKNTAPKEVTEVG